jgi:hypothetical protein
MVNLADAVLAWCWGLTPPVSAVPLVDFAVTDRADGQGPQITAWNTATLGKQPTATQLAAVTAQQVSAYYAGQATLGAEVYLTQVQALSVVIRAGLIALSQRLNEVIQAYNADRQTRGLAALTQASDATTIPPSPLTAALVQADAAAVLSETDWAI